MISFSSPPSLGITSSSIPGSRGPFDCLKGLCWYRGYSPQFPGLRHRYRTPFGCPSAVHTHALQELPEVTWVTLQFRWAILSRCTTDNQRVRQLLSSSVLPENLFGDVGTRRFSKLRLHNIRWCRSSYPSLESDGGTIPFLPFLQGDLRNSRTEFS